MKKLMSVLILFAMLLTMVACGADSTQASTGATEGTVDATNPSEETQGASSGIHEMTNEDLYGHINQLEPIGGVYKVWSAVGIQNMADHPDGEFELLCPIDMEGATVRPIGTEEKPFTGIIRGSDMTISNFTVQGGDEACFGFVGVNQGEIRNVILTNVTFVPGENAKHIGSFAGKNEGIILRSTINTSAMTVEKAPEGAVCGAFVGLNTGSITNSKAEVDLAYNAEGAATVGGIAGIAQGGELNRNEVNGKLEVAGANKTVGLFAGTSEGVVIATSSFLGSVNTVNGELMTKFTGNEDDEMVTVTEALLRDNSGRDVPDNVRALRDKVVKAMYDMGTIEWRVEKELNYTDRVWNTTYQFKGIPYNHKSGSLAQAQYMIRDDGFLIEDVYEWATSDSWDMYFGSDCSGALQQAWWTVSNSSNTFVTNYLYPYARCGALPVGDWEWDFDALTGTPKVSTPYMEANGEERMYEAYALLLAGDGVVYHTPAGGHCRMIAEDAVVVRNQNGKIDPQKSYVISHEQGNAVRDDVAGTYSSWNISRKQSFANLFYDAACPITIEELQTGEMEPVEVTLEGGAEGFAGMFSGKVTANYNIDSATLKITDSQGNVVLDKPFFVDVQKNSEFGNAYYAGRQLNFYFNMSDLGIFVTNLDLEIGQTYSYTVTINLHTFDHVVVKEGSFAYGS